LQGCTGFLAGLNVAGANAEGAVGVDLEGDSDRDLATCGRSKARELDLTEIGVLREHRAFALRDTNTNGRLHIATGCKATCALARDLRVTRNDRVGVAARRFDNETSRCDVDENGRLVGDALRCGGRLWNCGIEATTGCEVERLRWIGGRR
jgi:hypothetical protein